MSNDQEPPRTELGAMRVAPQVQRWQPYPKQFKGRCHYCGEQGHKTAECPNKGVASVATPGAIPSGGQWAPRPPATSNGGQWAPRQPCQHCQRTTHSSDRCWELEQNAATRPPNWRSVKDYQSYRSPATTFSSPANRAPTISVVCSHCESPRHKTEECPELKLKKFQEERTQVT